MTTAVSFTPTNWATTRVGPMALGAVLEAMASMGLGRADGFLREAGLERSRFTAAPRAAEGGVTYGEIAGFYGVLHTRLGETLARSFLMTHGRLISERLKAEPTFVALRSETTDIAIPGERLAWSVRAAAQLLSEPGNALEVEESSDEFRLSRAHCAMCSRVPNARAPFCASVEVTLTALIRELAGVRATAIEYECHAVGAERCRYRVRR
jgi:hypothetical protein